MSGIYHRSNLWVLQCVTIATIGLSETSLFAQAPEEDIRGPRELIEIPVVDQTPLGLWLALIGGVLVILLAWYLWRRFSRRKAGKTPLAVAFASLTELANTRETLTAEAFAERAAQTIRSYISQQFGIAAPRRTTEEFLGSLARDSSSPLGKESDHLRVFLKSCDLAKFAGASLSASQRDELLQTARGFITASSAPVVPPPLPASQP